LNSNANDWRKFDELDASWKMKNREKKEMKLSGQSS